MNGKIDSRQTALAGVSGETVVAKISGATVIAKISGETLLAKISGETVSTKISGETVIGKVSGETLIARVSGETITAKVSGETVSVGPGPSISALMRQVSSSSGGVVLHSGAILSVTVKNLAGQADMYIGGANTRPYSGSGFCLYSGEGVTMDVDGLDDVYVFACTSGQRVSWIALD